MKAKIAALFMALALSLLITGDGFSQSDLCSNVDMKPVLSLQQVRQAELVHYLVELDPGLNAPSPDGMSPEDLYEQELQMLMDAGYPPGFAEIEPDRLVTRRYFASMMYQVAVETDPQFAAQYGGLTDETAKMQALVDSEWLYAEEGRIYKEEILSVLCTKQPSAPTMAIDIEPVEIMDAILEPEAEASPTE